MKKPSPPQKPNRRKQRPPLPQLRNELTAKAHFAVWGWQVFVGALTVVSALLIWPQVRPNLTISIGPSQDPKLPFGTHFTIVNDSIYPIHNATYFCELWQMRTSTGPIRPMVRLTLDYKDNILPKGAVSAYCGGYVDGRYVSTYPPDDVARDLQSGNLDIYIYFGVWLWPWPIMRGFSFAMMRDKDGNVGWFPNGDADPSRPHPNE